jgi:GNAT superfamily N-acetyltransferase
MDPSPVTLASSPRVDPASTRSPPARASGTTVERPPAPAALDVKFEKLAGCIRELLPLIRADWEENGVDLERCPLNLAYDRYLDLDLHGTLLVVTARDEGVIAGFMFCLVNEHIDHIGYLWGLITWYYVHHAYRKQGVGRQMLTFLEGFLKEHKVRVLEASEKVHKRHGLFKGYRETDVVVRKVL